MLEKMIQNVTNETNATTQQNEDNNTALAVTYLVISVSVMLGNSLVFIVIVGSRELHLPSLWNLAFMAAWDFAYGLTLLVFCVPSAFLNRFAYSESMIGWAAAIGNIVTGQCILNIVMAVLDRYISICWPLKYVYIVTVKRFILAIVGSIALNILRACLIIFPEMDFFYNPIISVCVSNFDNVLAMLTWIIFTIGSSCVIVFCFSRIVLDISRSRRRVHPVSAEPRGNVVRFSLTTALATGVFCLSYMPAAIAILFNFVHGKGRNSEGLLKLAMISLASNSMWNVIIYATMYGPFKDALLRMFCKKYYRKRKQHEAIYITETINI